MNKIVQLTPALMLDRNRKQNLECMQWSLDNYDLDARVCYEQEFEDGDYLDGFQYISGNVKRQGFVIPRNTLLDWFYDSDYDYAMWMDGNCKIGAPCVNDLNTIFEHLRDGTLDIDYIHQTMGMYVDPYRILAKKRKDYFTHVYLLRTKEDVIQIHGAIFKNFRKYYGHKFMIDERVEPYNGVSEDVYWAHLLRLHVPFYTCPTIIASKPSNKHSTWMNEKENYDYPPLNYKRIMELANENLADIGVDKDGGPNYIKLERVQEESINWIQPYKPKKKKKK